MRWQEHGGYENPPPGSHLARCYSLIDLGTQVQTWQGHDKKVRQVRISFELPYAKMTGEYNADLQGQPFSVHLTCTQSLNEKSKLRKMLEGWRGKRFTVEELRGYDPRKLLGVPCRLSLIENDAGYVNIDSISRVTKEEQESMPALSGSKVYFSLEPDEFDQATFDRLSEKTQEKIRQTPEWRALWEEREQESYAESEDPDYENIPF